MKNNKGLYIILSVILLSLIGSSVYVNFFAKSSKLVSYILLGQIIVGVIAGMFTLFLCRNKKNHEVLFIAFLEILFVIALVTLNTIYGYNNVLNVHNYAEYMEYISMYFNIYVFVVFGGVIGLFSLNQYAKYRCNLIQ